MHRSDEQLRRAIADLLGTTTQPRDAIVEALRQGSVDVDATRERVDRLLQFDTSFAEVADGVLHVPSVLDGTSWKVWVDADDARDGFVRTHPHLTPLGWWLIGDDVPLLDDAGQTVDSQTSPTRPAG